MKRILSFFIIIIVACVGARAQQSPDWMDAAKRELLYPASDYFTGFASALLDDGEAVEDAFGRVATEAQTYLMESIVVSLRSQTTHELLARNDNSQAFSSETLTSRTDKQSQAIIPGLAVERHQFSKKRQTTLCAFAHVKKSELAVYYSNALKQSYEQLESQVRSIRNLKESKELAAARELCGQAWLTANQLRQSQLMLLAIRPATSSIALKVSPAEALADELRQLEASLDPRYERLEVVENGLLKAVSACESSLRTGNDLESSGQKLPAFRQYKDAQARLEEAIALQREMEQVMEGLSPERLHTTQVQQLSNTLTLALERVRHSTLLFVESHEEMLGKTSFMLSNLLKAQLSARGCSFTADPSAADYRLVVTSSIRTGDATGAIAVCHADIAYELVDQRTGLALFSNDITEKAGSSNAEKAARKGIENAVPRIMATLAEWFE